MYGRRGGFSRGGLYGNFVSSSSGAGGGGRGGPPASDSNRLYRGAEIAPPSNLTSSARSGAMGGSTSSFGERSFGGHPTPGVSKHGYSTMTSIGAQNITHDAGEVAVVKKQRTEEDYFNDDDEEDEAKKESDMPYQPAPGSPSYQAEGKKDEDSDSEEDPLDAFMADLEKDAKKQGEIEIHAGKGR